MKKIIPIISILLISISCSEENPQEVVRSYISAHNFHNLERAMSFYDENIVFELKGVWTKQGLTEIQGLEDWDAALSSDLKLESLTSKQDTVFCRIIENNEWFKAVNITDLVHEPVVFVIDHGKIRNIIGYPSAEQGKEIETAIIDLFRWSQKVQDSTIYSLIQEGEFVYSAKAAGQWIDLFKKRALSDIVNEGN